MKSLARLSLFGVFLSLSFPSLAGEASTSEFILIRFSKAVKAYLVPGKKELCPDISAESPEGKTYNSYVQERDRLAAQRCRANCCCHTIRAGVICHTATNIALTVLYGYGFGWVYEGTSIAKGLFYSLGTMGLTGSWLGNIVSYCPNACLSAVRKFGPKDRCCSLFHPLEDANLSSELSPLQKLAFMIKLMEELFSSPGKGDSEATQYFYSLSHPSEGKGQEKQMEMMTVPNIYKDSLRKAFQEGRFGLSDNVCSVFKALSDFQTSI